MLKENQAPVSVLMIFSSYWLYTQLGSLVAELQNYSPFSVSPWASVCTFSQWNARILEFSIWSGISAFTVYLLSGLISRFFRSGIHGDVPLSWGFPVWFSSRVSQLCALIHVTKLSFAFVLGSVLPLATESLPLRGIQVIFFLPGKALSFPFFSRVYCDCFTQWPLTLSAPTFLPVFR